MKTIALRAAIAALALLAPCGHAFARLGPLRDPLPDLPREPHGET
jgi:hypothetical protein